MEEKDLKRISIDAIDLPDSWYQLLYTLLKEGREFKIDKGSFAGQIRLEFDWVDVTIRQPYLRDADGRPLIPVMPEGLQLTAPVTKDYIDNYWSYLMTPEKKPDEDYTYGERLWAGGGYPRLRVNQVWVVIDTYKRFGHRNNQMVLQVAAPQDILLDDPPCLRAIDTRIQDGRLHFFPYFRCIDSKKEILYKVGTNICYGKMVDVHNLVKTGADVYIISNNGGKAEWGKVLESHIRKCGEDEIKKYSLKAEESTNITEDHWLFDDSLKIKQAKDFKVGDKQIKLISTAGLKREITTHLDLFTLFAEDINYYIRNLALIEIKRLCKFPKSSWLDKKVLPITAINELADIPVGCVIGVVRSKISRTRYMALSKDVGYFFGAWLANGWFKDNNCSLVAIGNYRKDKIDKLKIALSNAEIGYTTYIQDSVTIFHIGDKMLYDLMVILGFETGALFKTIPNFAFNAPKAFIKGMFEGWVDGDAGCTCSKDLAYGFRLLGSLVGIKTSLYEEDPRVVYFAMDDRYILSSKSYRVSEVEGIKNKVKEDIYYKKLEAITQVDVPVDSVIDFKIDKYENFCIGSGNIIVHNSWDLWGGYPANLAGISILQEYMAAEIGVEQGNMICSSKGLHIYGYAKEIAKIRCMTVK